MKTTTSGLKHKTAVISMAISAMLCGMFLFSAIAACFAGSSLLSAERHKQLMLSNQIYDKLETWFKAGAEKYLKENGGNSSSDRASRERLEIFIHNALTAESVRTNADDVLTGLLRYFAGDTAFLPDINLRKESSAENSAEKPETTVTAPSAGEMPDFSLEKINLSAVLMYFNRSDITDTFSFIRLSYKAAKQLVPILLLASGAFLSLALLPARQWRSRVRVITVVMGTMGILSIIGGCSLFYLSHVTLPAHWVSTSSLPFDRTTVMNYIHSFLLPLELSMLAAGLLLSAFLFIPKMKTIKSMELEDSKRNRMISGRVAFSLGLAALLLFSVCTIKSVLLTNDLMEKDFLSMLSAVTGTNTRIRVIPALNDTVYSLEVRLYDKSNGQPVAGEPVTIEGTEAGSGKGISACRRTEEDGSARFIVTSGSFTILLSSEKNGSKYRQPAPVDVRVETAGTTTVSIQLDPLEQEFEIPFRN